jgi:hypothetical protein
MALARHLAGALDQIDVARYPAQTASLARAHLNVLQTLRGLNVNDDDGAPLADLLAYLSTEVGDQAHTEP